MSAERRFPRPDYAGLSRYAPDRAPVPVDLSDNTNLWGTHPDALEVIRTAGVDGIARYPDLYAGDLKGAVARRFGVPERVVTTGCGSDDLLDAAFRACARVGGTVTYPAPTFSMVEPFAAMNGRETRAVPWSGAMDDPERLLGDDVVLVYLCRPNNPTGAQAPRAWLDALVEAAEARDDGGPMIVIDEAYADFAGESVLTRAPRTRRVLVTRTLSKAFGLAGMRVGFAVGGPEVVEEVEKARGPYKVSRLSEAAAVAALDDRESWVDDVVAETVTNRERLDAELSARGFEPLPSRANFVFLPVPDGTARKHAVRLREHGVGVRPFPDCPGIGDALRVTVGPWEMVARFLGALDELVDADPRAWGVGEVAR